MPSVVCPHCSSKIRLTRKKKTTSTEQPSGGTQKNDQSRDAEQVQKKAPRLPVPELSVPDSETLDAVEHEHAANDLPNIDVSRKRRQINLDGLEIGGLHNSELADRATSETGEGDGVPIIKPRRNRKQVKLDNLSLGDTESEPSLDTIQQPTQPDLVPERRSSISSEMNQSVDNKFGIAIEAGNASKEGKPAVSQKADEQGEAIDPADDLLPPKFLVADIEADGNAVVLPAAGGGLQVVDKTEVRVMHEGRAVKLVSLSPEELKRVRLIENLVALVIAAIMLAIAVWLVL